MSRGHVPNPQADDNKRDDNEKPKVYSSKSLDHCMSDSAFQTNGFATIELSSNKTQSKLERDLRDDWSIEENMQTDDSKKEQWPNLAEADSNQNQAKNVEHGERRVKRVRSLIDDLELM